MTKYSEQQLPHTLLFVLMSLSACFTVWVVSQNMWLDDAFISFRYARNLFEGHGLVYNPGERVEGYTNFLWTIVAYSGLQLGIEPITFSQGVSVVAQCVTLWLLYLLGLSPNRSAWRALIAPLFLAFQVGFLAYPMTGMETSFYTMLVILAVVLFHRDIYKTRAGSFLTGLVLLAIALTRFDGLVMVGILLSYKFLIDREVRSLRPLLVVFGVGILLYNAWRIAYYPTILPNTFYAKVGFSMTQFIKGVKYLFNFLTQNAHYAVLLGLLPFAFGNTRRIIRFAGWVTAFHLSYVVLVGGDWMPFFRFVLPVLPLLFLLMQEGIWEVFEGAARRISFSRRHRLLAMSMFLFLFLVSLQPLYRGRAFGGVIQQTAVNRVEHAPVIGKYLDEILPPHYVVATEWAGIGPYYMQQPVLDTFGLTDADIVTKDFPATTVGRLIPPDYLARRNPEVVLFHAAFFQSRDEAAAFTRKQVNPKRKFLWILAREYNYKPYIVEIKEGTYWSVLLREDVNIPGAEYLEWDKAMPVHHPAQKRQESGVEDAY